MSPRAVLSGASAVLISQASVAHPQPKFKAKSLLSDRLLLQQQQQQQPQAKEGGCGSNATAVNVPQRCSSERAVHTPALHAPLAAGQSRQQQAVAPAATAERPDLFRVSGDSGIVYRVELEWQEPPIRKVKMQGTAAQRNK